VGFLSREQTRDLIVLAERARKGLSTLAGHQVAYGVEAMQLLDEWIDDYLERSPDPPPEVRLLWTSLLGEMFRRRHDGWWALREDALVIVCPMGEGERRLVEVRDQVERRIDLGMAASLSYFYDVTRIELKLGSHESQ
jgi:hypothetical protein